MKIQLYPLKPFSWLEWPVTLKGLAEMHKAHITCKFLGPAVVDPKVVERLLGARSDRPWRPSEFEWDTRIWTGHDEAQYHVLALTKYPKMMYHAYKQFDLIKDSFQPWVPHITVPKAYFYLVEDQRFTPENCQMEVGEITLCLGGENT